MAATLKEIQLVQQARMQRLQNEGKKKKPTAFGTQLAGDIQQHFKFPEDEDPKTPTETK